MMGWMAPLRHLGAKMPVGQKPPANREPSMNEITTIGLDLAKHVFQVHGVDAAGATVLRKQLRRAQVLAFFSRLPRCLVGMEACATAHYWARELSALGHEVRLMPAQYVKAYIKRNKNDAADAEAICEAVSRPTMRFVPAKTAEQQAAVLLHRGRERLVRQRTMLVNALRAHLAEFGVIAPQGLRNVGKLIAIIRDEEDARLPGLARQVLQVLATQIEQIEAAVTVLEKQLMAWHKSNPVSQRLATIPGIGPIIATAIAAMVAEPSGFRSGREFAAWLGLVPRQNSTGGKNRLVEAITFVSSDSVISRVRSEWKMQIGVAAPEIGAPDAASKERVAGESDVASRRFTTNETLPGVCPGVCSTASSRLPAWTTTSSARSPSRSQLST